jgi:pilus assembly protein CpaB
LLGKKIALAASPRPQKVLRYVAAARSLDAGAVLIASDLAWVSWPVDDPLAGALPSVDTLPGRVVLYPLEQGQPVLERDLADPGTGGGLASRIPKGMRALALRSDDVVGVAGFLSPGSHVDVLVTYRTETSPEPLTATVLQDAEVLAAGQRMEPDPTGKPASATVVTLLLDPLEAERAVLASTQGTVHFVLRNGLDKDATKNMPMSLAWLAAGPGVGPPPVAETPRAARPQRPLAPLPIQVPGPGVETVLGGGSGNAPAQGPQP